MKNSKFQKEMLEIEELLDYNKSNILTHDIKLFNLISNCISNIEKHPELKELYYSYPNAYFHPGWKYAKLTYKRYNPIWTNEIYENIDDETIYIGRK